MNKIIKILFSEGTVSILFGCHSIIHSSLVLIAWIKLYGKLPRPWQIVCIFLHDIGHLGKNYLSSYEEKKDHWILGSNIAYRLFGNKGFFLVAGHCSHSKYHKSELHKADKYSWYIAPKWWIYLNTIAEPKLKGNKSRKDAVSYFKNCVKQSIESGQYKSTHNFYLKRNNETI